MEYTFWGTYMYIYKLVVKVNYSLYLRQSNYNICILISTVGDSGLPLVFSVYKSTKMVNTWIEVCSMFLIKYNIAIVVASGKQ